MPYDYFNIGAQQGQAIGQGLLAGGQAIAGGMEKAQEKKEKQEQQTFTRAMAKLSIYGKMAENIPDPAQRMEFLTGTLGPTFAELGMDKDSIGKISAVLTLSKEELGAFNAKSSAISEMMNSGDFDGASKAMNELKKAYGASNTPGVKEGFEKLDKSFTSERDYRRGRTAKGQELLIEGKVRKGVKGEESTIDFGDEGGLVPYTPEQRTQMDVAKAETLERAKGRVQEEQGPSKKDIFEADEAMKRIKIAYESKETTGKDKAMMKVLTDTHDENTKQIKALQMASAKGEGDDKKISRQIRALTEQNRKIVEDLKLLTSDEETKDATVKGLLGGSKDTLKNIDPLGIR
jgi:hypothetical protein